MQCVLPRADWSNDTLRTPLVTILRRLDKVFLKISKKPSIRVSIYHVILYEQLTIHVLILAQH